MVGGGGVRRRGKNHWGLGWREARHAVRKEDEEAPEEGCEPEADCACQRREYLIHETN